eukprot:TRINITY_DN4323_c0_g1_i3.p1 TRINITY_DN4323_c0_g1~~TRINITY_DN4323_c0_g1_i3.p1  ORF type:complete len:206 (+),score=8.43 TRINITY_DN4323_c0_g1_i3:142-759(+)
MQITDHGLAALSIAIFHLKYITSLSISVQSNDKITDKGASLIPQAVSALRLLFFFKLDFSCVMGVGQITSQSTAKAIRANFSIETIELDFSSTGITDSGIASLAELIPTVSSSVRSIELNLSNTKITDMAVSNLTTAILALSRIKKLVLKLNSCALISDHGGEIIEDFLRKHKTLISVNLALIHTQLRGKILQNIQNARRITLIH